MNVKNNKVLLIFGKPTMVASIMSLLRYQDFKMMEIGRSLENVCSYLQEHNFDPVILSIQDKAHRLDEGPVLFIGTPFNHHPQDISVFERLDFDLNQNHNNGNIKSVHSISIGQSLSTSKPIVKPGCKKKNDLNSFKETIFVKNDHKYEKVVLSDILWVEAHGAYCKLHTTKKELLLCINLSSFQKLVKVPYIVRIHRSFIINSHKIDAFEANYIHINSELIPMGPKYKDCLAEVFPYIDKTGIII